MVKTTNNAVNSVIPKYEIKISILIPVKNEVYNLARLFESLQNIDFPSDHFELIFIDDNSDDNSSGLIKNFIKGKYNFHLINARNKTINGKKGALDIGIKQSKFDFILQTDADCIVPKEWLNIFAAYFSTGYELIFGPAPVLQTSGILNSFICYENLRTQLLVNAFAKIGLPHSGAARNMGYRKQTLINLGGFEKFNETLSGDDDLFLREATVHKVRIKFITEKDAAVKTVSAKSFKQFLNQKARHVSTSHKYLLIHKVLLAKWHILNLIFLFSIIFAPFNMLFLLPFLLKIIFDTVTVKSLEYKFDYKFSTFVIPFFQILYECLLIVTFFRSFSFKNRWK